MSRANLRRTCAAAAALLALAGLFAHLTSAQHATPAVNGSIGAGEYGDHADGQNAKTNGGTTWYMTWDDANLYVGLAGANTAEGAVIYVDRHGPLAGPGTNADGNNSGQEYDNTRFSSLPFRADFVAYFKDSHREYRTADGAGNWSAPTAGFGAYASDASNVREIAIPWSAVTGAGRPSSFGFFAYAASPAGFVYGEVPPENPDGNVGTSASATRFYRVSSTANGLSTRPFSQSAAPSATHVVNSTADDPDLNNADGLCLTAGGVCTLRAAIEQSNADPGADAINFLIPTTDGGCNLSGVCTIRPLSPLPAVSQPADINGYSQPASSANTLAVGDNAQIKIELNGEDAGPGADGLRFTGGSSSVRGLAVYRFSGDGVELSGAGSSTVAGNFIGHTAAGAVVTGVGNGGNGVNVSGVSSNAVGGGDPAARNLIAQNGGDGVSIAGASAASNLVRGNYIGTDRDGTGDFGNLGNGVYLAAPSNTVGGATATPGQGAGNLIGGNALAGVRITAGGDSNSVAGNLIGLRSSGTAALANDLEGVFITNGAQSNTVGGASSDLRNVISGNNFSVNTDGVEINGAGTNLNTVAGNYIGLQPNGTTPLSNGGNGVRVAAGAQSNTVGGASADARNVISGNTTNADSDGVEIDGAGTSGNTVAGNYIGTDATGTLDRGNAGDGVRVSTNASANTVGGLTATPGAAPGNVISGNDSDGVQIGTGGAAATAPSNNNVRGNLIGTDAAGTATLRNTQNGVLIDASPGNTVGGTTATARNVITGGTTANSDGVDIQAEPSDNNTVAGNYIGTDINGAGTNGGACPAPAATDFGACNDGVRISAGPDNNTVGGTAAGAGNLIAGNASDGVEVAGANTTGNLVQGNLIGARADATTAYANGGHGVHLSGANGGSTVGGTAAGAANTIAFNGGDGVYVAAGAGNQIRRNSIHSNTGLGIDLGADGVTPNDPLDADAGANNLQNFPVITSATTGSTIIAGTLHSTPSTTFTIEFFANAAPDPSAHGEGQTFLDSISVTTDAAGNATFTHTAAASVPAGQVVTATATDPAGNTSEFSGTRQVLAPTAARLREFRAAALAAGVRLEWQTSFEADNLGFQIYREHEGRLVPLAPSLVAGSALLSNAALTSGHSYAWLDREGTPESRYYLEDVDTDGQRTLHGPFWPAGREARRPAERRQSPTLEQLGPPASPSGGAQRQFWEALAEGSRAVEVETEEVTPTQVTPTEVTPAAPAPSETHVVRGAPERGTTERGTLARPGFVSDEARGRGVHDRAPTGHAPLMTDTPARTLPNLSVARRRPANTPTVTSAPSALERQRELAAGAAVKLFVRRAGWHRVTRAALEAAGLNPSADPSRLRLYADGAEVAVKLDEAAWLAGAGAVEFYGTGLDTPSTDARVYWLVEGEPGGRRVGLAPAPPKTEPGGAAGWRASGVILGPTLGTPSRRGFSYTLELRERLVYFSSLLNGEAENFFGRVVGPAGLTQTLDARHIDRQVDVPAQLQLALQGVTLGAHEVHVELNGTPLGPVVFAGRERAVVEFRLSPESLREGANELRLRAAGGQADVSLTDFARLTYTRLLRAEDDRLWFPGDGGSSVRVSGFTTPDVRVVDVSDPSNPEELAAVVTPAPLHEGGFAAVVTPRANATGARTLLAFTAARAESPAGARPNAPSNLSGAGNAADYLVITREHLREALAPLVARRAAEGLAVAVVDAEDIFDEFSYGAHTPQAVRDFLAAASANWSRAPRFVLLAGDGSYDPRDYAGRGPSDLVPARLVDTKNMEAASDEWFADFDDDGVAEMFVGRLPVRTAAEAARVAARIAGHAPESQRRSVLLVSDRRGPDGFDFEAASDGLVGHVPGGFEVERVNRGARDAASVRSEIVEAIGEGQLVVNYLGHGSLGVWTGEGLLRSEDAAALANADRLSFFVLMTCLNGYFADPAVEGLGESLLKAGRGGAVAAWGSTGMTEPDTQAAMNRELYRLLFGGPVTLGEAVRGAKLIAPDRDVRRTWVLLGDPATRLR